MRNVPGQRDPGAVLDYRWRLSGPLDRRRLQGALDRIVARHESLRTSIAVIDGAAVQRIAPASARFSLRYQDLCAVALAEAAAAQAMEREAGEPFDLLAGPLARGRLIRLAADTHLLQLTLHTAIADHWSIGVLMRELDVLYAQPESAMHELQIRYADYAPWQRQLLSGAGLEYCRRFWERSLSGAPERLALPADRAAVGANERGTDAVAVHFGRELCHALTSLSKRHATTVPLLVAAAWAVVLARLSGQDEVLLDVLVPNRPLAELEGVIGAFANTVPLRVNLAGGASLADIVGLVARWERAARSHQFVPADQLAEWLAPLRGPGGGPLCQVLLAWQDNAMPSRLGGIALDRLPAGVLESHHDVMLELGGAGGDIAGRAVFRKDMFEAPSVRRHVGYLLRVLAALVDDAQCPAVQVELLGAEELEQLRSWNQPLADCPEQLCVHRRVEMQAAARPDAIALTYEGQSLSYAELNWRANLVAHRLRALGIVPDDRVAVCVERSLDMVVGLLGVLKAGAAYLPLDPAYPDSRLAYMLEDSAARAVLLQEALHGRLSALAALPCLVLDAAAQAGPSHQRDAHDNPGVKGLAPRHLAYVTYTSGSSGWPKGVMVEHRQVLNLLGTSGPWFEFGPQDVCALFHSFAIDSSVRVIWGTLMHGGRLVIAPYDKTVSPEARYRLICQAGVTVLNQTPSAFRQLLAVQVGAAGAHRLRQVLLGGEVVDPTLVRHWYARPENAATCLVNEYGPTEAAVYATWHRIGPGEAALATIPIGRPVRNVQIHILDGCRRPVPIGVTGELYIGGAGVARGYLARPELDAQRFLPDPFSAVPGARLYKTGDLGRYRPDGVIEYLGRNDEQVKIRGFRVELGEIATALNAHPAVREAEVVVRADPTGEPRLVAYLAMRWSATAEALRGYLAAILPAYMLPAAYVWLERLPLTAHGKLDRRALPEPDLDAFAARSYQPPEGGASSAWPRFGKSCLALPGSGATITSLNWAAIPCWRCACWLPCAPRAWRSMRRHFLPTRRCKRSPRR